MLMVCQAGGASFCGSFIIDGEVCLLDDKGIAELREDVAGRAVRKRDAPIVRRRIGASCAPAVRVRSCKRYRR
jgi:hypothetical protein